MTVNNLKNQKTKNSSGNIKRVLTAVVIIGAIILILHRLGVFSYLTLENISRIREWILSFGIWGPVIYIILWIAACVFFLPGLPVALVGGIAFGPLWATVYSSIGSTLGATAAFLIARYVARNMVEEWVNKSPQLKKIDEGVKKHGWRMLMITRLVPIFPFNVQNYVYGLTKISLTTYMLVSWICMLPGTIAYSFAGGSLSQGGDMKQTFIYLSIAAVFFVIISLIPGWIRKKKGDVIDNV
ncbi:Uncharacterized membrane protein YdjX, TVP38/TMEM64 family, SNARE-associated domain [Acetomicrobium thermoterrenum DSM 13490]|uniref:TVP38/TMEM64 family membrane protein n=2 Tax=Acetomicrobium TaxID=49894 RepID=A0A0T5X946_9BACT|nr:MULTISPECIES: TVP38/TMEM64 family protein [Acetomicrobium]KRT34806.1 SNARE-like domain protein [Acetomicrobium hydrogeniformans ATCC BAA-1850]SDX85528.1 Uncharacterized membrane protein YdjX, TVP38/TMEM64 family, SNARE-associated domain [Acetomicrobium thermoterrenum DSM 13490]